MSVNIKELCKHIKRSSKSLIWTLENGIHYITNRHWAVKFDELPREVLISMFSVFADKPTEGKSLVMTRWGDTEHSLVSLEKIFKDCESYSTKGTITNIILDYGDNTYRVIKTNEFIIKLNNHYMSMVGTGTETANCSNRMMPVSFADNQLILLPVRSENREEDETIKDLLAG